MLQLYYDAKHYFVSLLYMFGLHSETHDVP